MFMDSSFIYGQGGRVISMMKLLTSKGIYIYIYIHINLLKSETMRDLHLNLKPIQDVDTGRTRNHLKKEEEAQLRQRYQDAYKIGREREKEGKERALREEYLFPRKSMLGHRLLRSGCWI